MKRGKRKVYTGKKPQTVCRVNSRMKENSRVIIKHLRKIHVTGFSTTSMSVGSLPSICSLCNKSMSQHPCLWILYLEDPLQDPCLWVLYKIHVSGPKPQHPCLWILYKIHVSGSTPLHPYLWVRYKIRVSSGSSTGPMSLGPLHAVFQDPLQDHDPCLRIHVSASLSICGSSTRPMSPNPRRCLSIRICGSIIEDPCLSPWSSTERLRKIHVSGSAYKIMIPVPARSSATSMSLDVMSWRPHLWVYKIHVSGPMSQHRENSSTGTRIPQKHGGNQKQHRATAKGVRRPEPSRSTRRCNESGSARTTESCTTTNTQKAPRKLHGRNQKRRRATMTAIWHARTQGLRDKRRATARLGPTGNMKSAPARKKKNRQPLEGIGHRLLGWAGVSKQYDLLHYSGATQSALGIWAMLRQAVGKKPFKAWDLQKLGFGWSTGESCVFILTFGRCEQAPAIGGNDCLLTNNMKGVGWFGRSFFPNFRATYCLSKVARRSAASALVTLTAGPRYRLLAKARVSQYKANVTQWHEATEAQLPWGPPFPKAKFWP